MLTNLFSIFDPTMYMISPFFVVMSFFLVVFINKKIWLMESKEMKIKNITEKKIMTESSNEVSSFLNFKKNIKKKGIMKLIVTAFMFIFLINYCSLFPYIMSMTSHMSFNLAYSMALWLIATCLGLYTNIKHFLAHLTPMGTPIALMSFMVLIETISNIIRPLTLAVRLMANMIAGHLLLTLLSNFSMMNLQISIFTSIFMFILSLLESGVSFIQAYVITLLFILYVKESF